MSEAESDRGDAASQLDAVRRAAAAAQSAGYNNGVALMVWGAVLIVTFTLFDVAGPMFGAIASFPVAGSVALWNRWYKLHRPVQTGCAPTKRIVMAWAIYYAVSLFAIVRTVHGYFHESPPQGFFTAFGFVAAAPLLLGGWRMRRDLTREETRRVDVR